VEGVPRQCLTRGFDHKNSQGWDRFPEEVALKLTSKESRQGQGESA
jgi:hypothetical protein